MGGVRWQARLAGLLLLYQPSLRTHTSAWFRCRTEPLICGVVTPALHFRSLPFFLGNCRAPLRDFTSQFWSVSWYCRIRLALSIWDWDQLYSSARPAASRILATLAAAPLTDYYLSVLELISLTLHAFYRGAVRFRIQRGISGEVPAACVSFVF